MSTKTMLSVVSGAILMGLAASSGADAIYEFPTGRSFPTNPTGQWSLYTGPQSWSKVSDLTLAVNGGGQTWNDSVSGREPVYNWYGSQDWTISEYTPWSRAGVIVFTCPSNGLYSFDLQIFTYARTQYDPTTESLKVGISTNDASAAQVLWSNSHYWTADGQTVYDNLSVVPELQNILLYAGNKIFISADLSSGNNYSAVSTFIVPVGTDTNGNIAFVPEPAALSLLALGGLALLRRRRS